MNRITPNQTQKPKHHQCRWCALLLLLFCVILASCNFPQSGIAPQSYSRRRQTEIAGILNPVGLNTPESTSTPVLEPVIEAPDGPSIEYVDGYVIYTIQQGDTLPALASRFDVPMNAFLSEAPLSENNLLPIGLQLRVPDVLEEVLPYHDRLLPDSEVVYGPSVSNFDAAAYAVSAGGFLTSYTEIVKGEVLNGPDIVQIVAVETGTNPRLLLAFLEYQSGWVFSHPANAENDIYPIGFGATADTGLYKELMITAKVLAQGYYGWRDGSRIDLVFSSGGGGRLSPGLNAGSTALMQLFASIYPQSAWEERLFGSESFLQSYHEMFGDYWGRASAVEPMLLNTVWQPDLSLPFAVGEAWSLTGGPHISWQTGTPRGAVDFAPITGEPSCAVSIRWVMAAAPGLVVRSDRGVVALDLDGDGDEGTGWVLIYLHIAEKDRVPAGTWLAQDDRIGHPSCEGGQASGTHVHFARKYNGEWIGVGDPLPMVLSGWRAFAGVGRYEGYLQKGDQIVTNRADGSAGSTIIREN